MKILLIGSGGREHAIAIRLSESPKCTKLYIAPGNPGTENLGQNVPIASDNIYDLLHFAKTHGIDMTIVGPEGPLVAGIVDEFEKEGLVIIGPNQAAARLEGSKRWAKEMMLKYNVRTAPCQFFSQYSHAIAYLKSRNTYPIVIKADGLAQGKGVTVAHSLEEAETALRECFVDQVFGDAGKEVLIEDFLTGQEASILAFVDGETVIPMVSAQDHKAIFDGDKGPNTGGMGAYSPTPVVTTKVETETYHDIFMPLIKGLKSDGIVYKGILYAGLMISDDTPYVIEFNVRFGDPEAQVVLKRLETDLVDIFQAIADQTLHEMQIDWNLNYAVCVVLASQGYPGKYEIGQPITGIKAVAESTNHWLIHAGTVKKEGQILTNGGRVMGVVGCGRALKHAIESTYTALNWIQYDTKYYRRDIGAKALKLLNDTEAVI